MLLHSTEVMVLETAAILVIGAILLGIADTPLYPVAIGIELVALAYVLILNKGMLQPTGLLNFLSNPSSLAK